MRKSSMVLFLVCVWICTQALLARCLSQEAKLSNGGHKHRIPDVDKPNILMIMIDDFRPQFEAMKGRYFPSSSFPTMITPSLDKLASESALFRNAYAQFPLCGPSRASLLTGRRPDSTVQYSFIPYRVLGQNFTSLPQYFKENGYVTYGIGKIFHRTKYRERENMPVPDESVYAFNAPNYIIADNFWNIENDVSWLGIDDKTRALRRFQQLPDEMIRDHALSRLQQVAPAALAGEKNFFVAVGFHKPHCPFIFPREYLSNYSDVNLPSSNHLTDQLPEVAWFDYLDMRKRYDLVEAGVTGEYNTSIPDEITVDLRRAYYSSISYIDDLVGEVLTELDNLGLRNITIVALLSDHGYHLGENLLWGKELLTDLATHTPLMIRIPGVTDARQQVRDELVELVDLFPTLVELADLPSLPRCPRSNSKQVPACHEGSSLVPLMFQDDPNIHPTKWKNAVFSQTSRWGDKNIDVMGHSIKTKYYRYTAWIGVKFRLRSHFEFDWDDIRAVELYDHQKDPEETRNVAGLPAYRELQTSLHQRLKSGWRAALPRAQTS